MKRKFVKYSSIENHYRGKYIDRFTSMFPDMIEEKYLVTEKIHGANFSINIFDKGEEVLFGKRTSLLQPEEGFMNHQNVMAQEEEKALTDALCAYADERSIETMRVYGEIFGEGVQKFDYKKIETPTKKTFRLFDIVVDERKLLPVEVFELLDYIQMQHMHVPIIMVSNNLQEALDVETKFRSAFSSDECEYDCEGVVIRPYRVQKMSISEGKEEPYNFILKKKNEHFTEKNKANKEANVFVGSDEFKRLLAEYKSYFTKGRIESVFSKEGMIAEPKQFGQYIKLMGEDVKEDFFKDHLDAFKVLDDKEKKNIMKVNGQMTVDLLKQYL